jgi:hypothetical protein
MAGVAIPAVALAACATPAPSADQTKVLHIESQVSNAVLVGVWDRGGSAEPYLNVIHGCGSRLDLAVGGEIPISDDWVIGLYVDPTGQLDAGVPASSGDLTELLPSTSIIWSRGDIKTADLPEWVTVTSTETVQANLPTTAPSLDPCPSYAPPTEP